MILICLYLSETAQSMIHSDFHKKIVQYTCPLILNTGLLHSSCSSTGATDPDPKDTTSVAPVETGPPNSDYEPAFEGQTRVPGAVTQTEYSVTEFAQGLSNPWGMANLPDGRIIVTEKAGVLRIVDQSGEVSDPISGLPPVNSAGQGGLLDVAVDPDFHTNRMLYWSFSHEGTNGTATAIGKGKLSMDESLVEDAEIIYIAIPEYNGNLHYGSRIVWDANGNMFVSTGERSNRSIRGEAQEMDAAIGKILHITKDGDPVPGNPFADQPGVLPEIYTYGHRNPQGLAVHPMTGELWAAEFGPRGGDEVNRIEPGKNYGWPVITYGIEYNGAPVGEGITQKEGMTQPRYYWDPAVSPSGITFYSGGLIGEWANNLFLAALSGQHLVRLVIEDNRVVCEERLLEGVSRFRDVLEGPDGALYVIEDGGNAVMYRIGL
jgi:glucose/arabinose dehydrogenase